MTEEFPLQQHNEWGWVSYLADVLSPFNHLGLYQGLCMETIVTKVLQRSILGGGGDCCPLTHLDILLLLGRLAKEGAGDAMSTDLALWKHTQSGNFNINDNRIPLLCKQRALRTYLGNVQVFWGTASSIFFRRIKINVDMKLLPRDI